MEVLGLCIKDGFDSITIGIHNEGGVVVLAVVGPKPWATVVFASVLKCCLMKECYCLP